MEFYFSSWGWALTPLCDCASAVFVFLLLLYRNGSGLGDFDLAL